MNRTIANTLGIVSILAVCLLGWAAWRLGVMADGVKVPDMTASVAKLNQTLDAVNAPCVGFHGSVTCGPLAQLSQTIKNVGILAGQSAEQVKQTGVLVTSTAQTLNTVGDSVNRVADKLSGTAQALTGTATAATGTLQEGQRTLAAFQPVLGHADATVADLDAAIKTDAGPFNATLVNVQTMTGAAAHIINDGQRVADDATDKYFKPVPWWRKGLPYVTAGAKIAAYALPW